MPEPKTCPYSGRSTVRCKVSDLCDCFEFPFAESAAVEIIRRRRDARTTPQHETSAAHETEESQP